MTTAETRPATVVAEQLVAAIAAKDFEAVEDLLAPEIRFRAMVPSRIREHENAAETAERFRLWFGDVDELELVESEADVIGGRVRLRYRLRGDEPGEGWSTAEQVGYADVVDGRITDLSLVCSGWRPADRPR
jgi:hypothetical protein